MPADLYLGIDLGTSGARVVIIDTTNAIVASGRASMDGDRRSPDCWWQATSRALREALSGIDARSIRALSVDGTSGTVLPVDSDGAPLASARMYNDASNDQDLLERLKATAPATSGAHGSTSGLIKALHFQALGPHRILHQADWLQFRFSGRLVSDFNNALKTGFDPVEECWPGWIDNLGLDRSLLPEVLPPGSVIGRITHDAATEFGLPDNLVVVAGTTDGCASFLATGADHPGDGVTALGTTLTLKLFSDKPVFAPEFGIYSHKLLGKWLAGGASNTGGNVLLAHFDPDELETLSTSIDPTTTTGLDYYPLNQPGERFPIADPTLEPRMAPRPAEPAIFLQAMLEGIAAIEKLGYDKLAELGAPKLASIRSVGGGARNRVWSEIRRRSLNVPFMEPASDEAAFGTALLAKTAFI
jgi:sugar (pentulose or hexulose) kinase